MRGPDPFAYLRLGRAAVSLTLRLWQDIFKSLKRFTISLNFESISVPSYGEDLYNHEYAELRSQRGVAVDITSNPLLSNSRPVDYSMLNCPYFV